MPRVNAEQLLSAGARLGEVVLDPCLWPQLLEAICRPINSVGAVLLQSDVRTPDIPMTDSVKSAFEAYFRDGWHTRDLRARGVPLLMRGVPVITDDDITTADEMRKSAFYNECIFAGGLQWWAAVGFRSGESHWALSVQRTAREGRFAAEEKRLLAQLSPRLSEVATLSKAVGRVTLLGSTNALASVCYPAVAIDHFGLVLEANASMEPLFDHDINIRNRSLRVADREAKTALDLMIERIKASGDSGGIAAEPIVLKRTLGSPVIVRALPVPPAARSPFLGARAILTFDEIVPKLRPDANLLTKIFGLTPAEAKLAAALATGMSIEDAAKEIRISRETVRSHLKHVFLKTDTHRQSQLVALLARV